MAKRTPWDKLRLMNEGERVGDSTVAIVNDEIDVQAIRDAAAALEELADALDELADAAQAKVDACTAEDRRDARDEALAALETAIGALNALPGDNDAFVELCGEAS